MRDSELVLDLFNLSGGFAVLGVVGAEVGLDVDEFLAGIVQFLRERFESSPWVDDLGGFQDPPWTEFQAASLRTRSAWALVYSVLSCRRREERMLVFSSGLMTLSSCSNWARAAEERSILAFSSSICFSMKEASAAAERKRMS